MEHLASDRLIGVGSNTQLSPFHPDTDETLALSKIYKRVDLQLVLCSGQHVREYDRSPTGFVGKPTHELASFLMQEGYQHGFTSIDGRFDLKEVLRARNFASRTSIE